MKIPEALKQKLFPLLAVIFGLVVVFTIAGQDLEHYEDTNGPENYSLQTITEQQIIDRSIGALGGPNVTRSSLLGSTVEFSAKKYTGVSEILYDNFLLPSDFEVNLTNYYIHEGNFQLVVVHDDAIVAVLEPGMFVNYRLEDVTGYVALRIVGESAAFTFSISEYEYDFHDHE